VRTINSPTAPGATSQSFSSTTLASTPGRGRPQVPSGAGFLADRIGVDTSVMLNTV
jgi:hypothetical protein